VDEIHAPAGVVKLFAPLGGRASNRFVTTDRPFDETSRRDRERRRLRHDVPFPPAPAHHRAIVGRRQRMAAWPKLVADRTEHGAEARRVPQALESLQTSLTLANGASSRLGCSDASRGDGRRSASRRRSPPRSSPVDRSRGRAVPFVVPLRVCERIASRRVRSAGVGPGCRARRRRHRRPATASRASH
jgi:hypothetical protein